MLNKIIYVRKYITSESFRREAGFVKYSTEIKAINLNYLKIISIMLGDKAQKY